ASVIPIGDAGVADHGPAAVVANSTWGVVILSSPKFHGSWNEFVTAVCAAVIPSTVPSSFTAAEIAAASQKDCASDLAIYILPMSTAKPATPSRNKMESVTAITTKPRCDFRRLSMVSPFQLRLVSTRLPKEAFLEIAPLFVGRC